MGITTRGLSDIESNAKQERLKFIFLGIIFFFVIGGYTIAKELKDSIFASIIGKEYIPLAKIIAMFVLVPAIFVYSL
ncbi:MAG TPA: Npt1/Npt2 family nucleotide transporter, partial [Candidatus Babeliales bacterium]|nr:Npt1/Npt2 family nucleotide transporter [Candidatus Babeliales bacterium]